MSRFSHPDALQVPDQILDPHARRSSIFVDRNNLYDLREARDVEQASLKLDAADQKKFGTAFVKFPKVRQQLFQHPVDHL